MYLDVRRADRYRRRRRFTSRRNTVHCDCSSVTNAAGVSLSVFLALSLSLSPCFCRLSSSTSAVHCRDGWAAVAVIKPAILLGGGQRLQDGRSMTSSGRRGQRIEASTTDRSSTAVDRPGVLSGSGAVRSSTRRLRRVIFDRRQRMCSTATANLLSRIGDDTRHRRISVISSRRRVLFFYRT